MWIRLTELTVLKMCVRLFYAQNLVSSNSVVLHYQTCEWECFELNIFQHSDNSRVQTRLFILLYFLFCANFLWRVNRVLSAFVFFYRAASVNQKFQPIFRSSELGLSQITFYYSKRHFCEIETKKLFSSRLLAVLQPSRINGSLQDLRWTYVIFIFCIPFCYMTKKGNIKTILLLF